MKLPVPLTRGTLVKRYKRFLADVTLDDGETITAHCANPGSMMGLQEPGSEVWLSKSDNPKRKLAYSWELLRVGEDLVGINTARPNAIVAEAVEAGRIPEAAGYGRLRREVKYGKASRVDMLLEDGPRPDCYLEVKNVHLRRGGPAEFPDSVTARGARHLEELGDMVEAGHRSLMFYLVQRTDCDRFAIAGDIDPTYAKALDRALGRGVEAVCYCCKISLDEIVVDRALPLEL
jgi:sugar fermentation stimulation protein A